MRITTVVLLAFAMSLFSGQAAVITYTDSATWLTAAGGSASFSENFEGFTVDTSFENSAVQLNGFTLQQQGTRTFRNQVDVSPLQFGDNGGTAHASMFVEGDTPVTVLLTPTLAMSAFSANFYSVNSGETLDLLLNLVGGGTVRLTPAWTGTSQFLGFVLTNGEQVSSIRFLARTADGEAAAGEGFGMDNVSGVNAASGIPEPATYLLTGVALSALALLRKKYTL